MDYEKLYKEALERASKYYNANTNKGYREIFEDIFHEFKESEDERIRKEIISFITDRKNWFPKEETKSSWIAWLEKQGEQKSSWSEEDEKFFKTALWHISYSISNGKSTDIHCDTTDWFKSLKDRVHPKPKQEWSEDDEEMYKEVLTDIIYAKNDLKTKGCLELSNRAMKAFNWFSKRHKSLRPQSKWKPSEEQMKGM